MKFRMLAVLVLIAAGVALATINLTGEAEPTWLERTVAFGFLRARIRLSGTPNAVPADSNGRRSREIYQERCAFCHGEVDGTLATFAHSLSPRPPQACRPFARCPMPTLGAWRCT